MCHFFSFIQAVIDGSVQYFYSLETDSHTSIAHEAGIAKEIYNQYEYNPDTDKLTIDALREKISPAGETLTLHAHEWVRALAATPTFDAILSSRGMLPRNPDDWRGVSTEVLLKHSEKTIDYCLEKRKSPSDQWAILTRLVNNHANTYTPEGERYGREAVKILETIEYSDTYLAMMINWIRYAYSAGDVFHNTVRRIGREWRNARKFYEVTLGDEENTKILRSLRELSLAEQEETMISRVLNCGIISQSIRGLLRDQRETEKDRLRNANKKILENLVFPELVDDPMANPVVSSWELFLEGKGCPPNWGSIPYEIAKKVAGKRACVIARVLQHARARDLSEILASLKGTLEASEIRMIRKLVKRGIGGMDREALGAELSPLYSSCRNGWGHVSYDLHFDILTAKAWNKLGLPVRLEWKEEVVVKRQYIKHKGKNIPTRETRVTMIQDVQFVTDTEVVVRLQGEAEVTRTVNKLKGE